MKITTITTDLLLDIGVNDSIISFFSKNKLDGFPVSKVDEIEGEYLGFASMMRDLNEVEFDDMNNVIYFLSRFGYEYRNEFNNEGLLIHHKDNREYELWNEYNNKGLLIYSRNSKKMRYWEKHDDDGRIIHHRDDRGLVYSVVYGDGYTNFLSKDGYTYRSETYDSNGLIISYWTSNGYEYWCDRDGNGNIVYYKNSNGYEYWKEYDNRNNEISFINTNGLKYTKKYDHNDNLIYYVNNGNIKRELSTEYYSSGQLKSFGEIFIPKI